MSTLAERLEAVRRSHFVGRETELSLFRSALGGDDPPFFVLFVFGPGGVGKSTFLRECMYQAKQANIPAVRLDGRHIDPNPDLFLLNLQQVLGLHSPAEIYDFLGKQNGRFVILIDTYELLKPIDGWLRDIFLPHLPSNVLLVIAGRQSPSLQWRTDPGWQHLVRILPLRNLDIEQSRSYLLNRNVPVDQHDTFLNFTHGHPLALSLVADLFAQRPDFQFQPENTPDIIKVLLEQLIQEVPSPHHREALEACALVRFTTEALLAEMLAVPDAHELFQWLRNLSFLDAVQHGLFPHDLAREALTADLRWRNPDWYAELHRRARVYYMKHLEHSQSREQRRVLLDYIYLHRDNPVVRPYFEWQESGTVFTDRMRTDEETAVIKMIAKHEGAASAHIAQLWLTLQPEAITVFRDSTGKIQGVLIMLALEKSTPADREADPAILAAWNYLKNTAPLRAGEHATYFRFWLADETYQVVSPVQSRIFLNMVQHYLTTPDLAFTFIPCADPDFWAGIFTYADLSLLAEANFEIDGHQFGVYGHDWRAVPPVSWLNLMAEREIATTLPKSSSQSPEPLIVLSESDFATALRSALRDFTDTVALTGNPLIRSQLVARQVQANANEKTRAAALQELLRETATSLQNTPRQAKFYRALHHTYFQPAPTQEKAAELLDLPFSTYRRHLRSGIQYMRERLWQLELNAAAHR